MAIKPMTNVNDHLPILPYNDREWERPFHNQIKKRKKDTYEKTRSENG